GHPDGRDEEEGDGHHQQVDERDHVDVRVRGLLAFVTATDVYTTHGLTSSRSVSHARVTRTPFRQPAFGEVPRFIGPVLRKRGLRGTAAPATAPLPMRMLLRRLTDRRDV